MTEKIAQLRILKLPFLCFSEAANASNLSFSVPAIVCRHVGIPAFLVSFLHCSYILVEGLSSIYYYDSKFLGK